MFGKPTNPYDEIINKATDEKQTEINWETALSVWDKVNEDGETGARNSVNALAKRLTHRSANVQLFSLTLAGALVNNCGPSLHREISGKAFTQALTRLINDRTTHDSVKKEALKSIEEWVKEHPNNSDFDLLNDTYESLKRQNHKFPSSAARNPSSPRVDDDALRREEEDLQRALAESAALSNPLRGYQPSSSSNSQPQSHSNAETTKSLPSEPASQSNPSRVQALYDFVGQSVEELEFRRGDIIRVVECLYEDWWKGENLNQRGRIGIFPRNHVQPLPEEEEPKPRQGSTSQFNSHAAASEEDLEAEVFAQVALVDRLLALMSQLREQGQDFADNDELTDLYNSSMRLRPRVVKLIRKYDQKQADLEDMNRKVDQARGIYEGMLGQHRPQQLPPQQQQQQQQPHAYAQPQTNGYHAQPPPSSNPHAAEPYRAFSPAANVPQSQHAPYPMQQHQHAAPQSQVPAQAGVDPAIEEQQRREYEQKWAEYERQMEEYNRQLAAHQQYCQQQPGGPPEGAPVPNDPNAQHQAGPFPGQAQSSDPSYPSHGPPPSHHPNPATSPVPSLTRSQSSTSQPHGALAQSQPQPEWNGQAWVWPTQVAVAAPQPQPATSPVPAHSPALSHSQQQPHFSSIASPPPNVALYSSPPSTAHPHQHQQQQNGIMSGLTDGVAGMGLNGTPGGAYYQPGTGGEDPAQAQWATSGGAAAGWNGGAVPPQGHH
ncbi:hypothetical protein JCM11491_000635 [Sporobolomyces phaffii]